MDLNVSKRVAHSNTRCLCGLLVAGYTAVPFASISTQMAQACRALPYISETRLHLWWSLQRIASECRATRVAPYTTVWDANVHDTTRRRSRGMVPWGSKRG